MSREQTTIRGVSLGDKFKVRQYPDDIFTVIDFLTTKNMAGDIVGQQVLAEGKWSKGKFPFSTVVLNKITK